MYLSTKLTPGYVIHAFTFSGGSQPSPAYDPHKILPSLVHFVVGRIQVTIMTYKKLVYSGSAIKGLLAIAILATTTKACSHSEPDGKLYNLFGNYTMVKPLGIYWF